MISKKVLYSVQQSPFGLCFVAILGKEIAAISFPNTGSKKEVVETLGEKWPKAILEENEATLAPYFKKIFAKSNASSTKKPSFILEGTPFQKKVWQALLKIPRGETSTYTAIAKAIGSPKAVRAVGTACGKNNIAYLIPCHRVLTSSGQLGGYRWGAARKKAILAWEQ